MKRCVPVLLALASAAIASPALAVGESVNGFPNWNERVIHEWMNRARCDPAVEMTACGSACPDAANQCYKPIAPLVYESKLNVAARFHSDHMKALGYFAHNSACTLAPNIGTTYPATCNGMASCSCQGGMVSGSTTPSARAALFGASWNGEIIASSNDPNSAFYQWLYESFNQATCQYVQGPPTNGHRWLILKGGPLVGVGVGASAPSVGDFSGPNPTIPKIPSGSHYPRQAASVDAWANWYDGAGPKSALVNVDGTCQPMTLSRGTATNGAYKATITGVGSGCHRYFFLFKDAQDNVVTFPTTGSLGIGPAGSCADWDATRPATGAGCACTPQCQGKMCGDDGCGGSCGNCMGGQVCQGNQCVSPPMPDGGSGDGGGATADGGGTAADGGGDLPLPDGGVLLPDGAVVPGAHDGGNGFGPDGTPSGCSCEVAGGKRTASGSVAALALAVALLASRRRRPADPRNF
jgi:MYXO-CTERM domain-containing protein